MSSKIITLYHGSQDIVEKPEFGKGKLNNDYGQGFYCTKDVELAMEWACPSDDSDGFANIYHLDTEGLKKLDLEGPGFSILHWITILIENRVFNIDSDIEEEARGFLIEHFHIDLSEFDIVQGWRADDSYFSYASSFLNNGMTVQNLKKAMIFGNLGDQIVLKSKRAFDRIEFEGCEKADASIYGVRRRTRDRRAREAYQELRRNSRASSDDVRIADLVVGSVKIDDPRLFRFLPAGHEEKPRHPLPYLRLPGRHGHRRYRSDVRIIVDRQRNRIW